MTAARATTQQIRAIKAAARRLGLDDPAYREALTSFGVVSSTDLTPGQAGALLDRWNGGRAAFERPSNDRADGPNRRILQALWLSGYNLGVIRDKTDPALHAWIADRFGISHTRFLRDPKDTAKAIDGLKAWLAREAGVIWPPRGSVGGIDEKRAVVAAQYQRLEDHGIRPPLRPLATLSGPELDALATELGRELRDAIGRAG